MTLYQFEIRYININTNHIYHCTHTHPQTEKSRLFKGFAKFRKRTDAEKAKSSLDGKDLDLPNGHRTTKPVRIGWGDANTQRNCVHVQFDSHAVCYVIRIV